MRTQRTNRNALLGALAAVALLLFFASPASAAPQWKIKPLSAPTLTPVDFPETEIQDNLIHYYFQVRNFGDSPAPAAPAGDSTNCEPGGAVPANCYEISLDFPPGIEPLEAVLSVPGEAEFLNCPVDGGSGLVTCQVPGNLANQLIQPQVDVAPKGMITAKVSAPPGLHDVALEASGAGAGSDSVLHSIEVDPNPPLFEVAKFDGQISADPAGAHLAQAGAHPYDFTTSLEVESAPFPGEIGKESFGPLNPVEAPKDIVVDLPAGFVGNPTTAERCTAAELAVTQAGGGTTPTPLCPVGSQVGTTLVRTAAANGSLLGPAALYNMEPPPGIAARFGFQILGTVVMIDAKLRTEPDYGITVLAHNIVQALGIQGSEVTVWGVPSDQSHDSARACPGEFQPWSGGPTCPTSAPEVPFFRNPTSCTAPKEGLPFSMRTHSWQDPGDFKTASFETHEPIGYPAHPSLWGDKKGIEDCDKVPFEAKLEAQPTSIDTQTASGLEVQVEIPDPHPGPESSEGIANSDIKAVKVSLPEGVTINPSQAEGLGACSPAQYESTVLSLFPTPGKGCPDDAKIGSVQVKTPLLEETIPGDVFIASPHDNPFNSLLALYIVLAEPERGILIKLAGRVDTDPVSGQISSTFRDLPQLPFETFDFRFREGSRAPLVTPAACGSYETTAEITGYADPAHPIVDTSSFEITRGIGGAPCPSGGLPPFKPGLVAGSINNAAGAFSPFNIRLFRTDAEQEITHFSIKLPPGITGKLAGVPFCPDSAIEAAKLRSGAEELIAPSCPSASLVGRTLVGAGVGSVQTYVPGKVYLAGPYNGSALSVAAITAAKVGPFDLGTVVVRQALKVNPETAEVFIDATGSDAIPHIIDGITTHIRDIRAYVDRPEFTLNPTSCKRTSTASTVLGSGLDFTSAIDDRPVTVTTPYQAANCASLGFKPRLKISLKGGTKRGQYPSLRAELNMKGSGEAAISSAEVTLPHSEFLANAHIGTVCTRVQFKADACPPRSVYGRARAVTPILDEALEGPVYLRSSENPLPDLVAKLRSGRIEVHLVGRIDSVGNGQIRSTFEAVPDAPVKKFVLTMLGGKKGLLENSVNLCAKAHRASVKFDAHNGKTRDFNPVVKADCKGKAQRKQGRGQKPRG